MKTVLIIINILVALALVGAGALIHRIWKKGQQKAEKADDQQYRS